MKIAALFAVAALLVSPPVQRPPAAGSTLKFAWPPGTTALVETEYERENGLESAPERTSLRMTHRMRVLAHREGVDIRFEDQRHIESGGNFEPAARALVHLWTPHTIVAADGTFARIEGGERVQDLVMATVAPIERVSAAMPGLRAFLAPMLGERRLESLQEDEWRKLVWQWIGLSSTQARLEIVGSDPVIPGVVIPTKRTIEIVERARCARGAAAYECLTLEMRTSSTDSLALKSLFEPLIQALGLSALSLQPRDFENVNRVTLETATMLPHESLQINTMHGAAVMNWSPVALEQVERRHARFTYDPR